SFIAEVVPGHAVFRQFSDDVVCDFLRCLQKLRIPGFTICSSKSVEGPSCTARPTRLPGISLMSVIEDALTWFCIIWKYEAVVLFIPAELELLTVVARVVMNRLYHRPVIPNEPIRRRQSVLQSDIAIFGIASLMARPPQELQVHHSVDDRVVSVCLPRGNQLCDRVKHLYQMISPAESAGAHLGITGQLKSGD